MSHEFAEIETEELPEPLDFLANEVAELNREWIENHKGTYGADYLEENIFTRNQKRWIREIEQQINEERPDKE